MQKNMKKEKKFISLLSDVTFKYMFKNEKTRPWFEDIIKSVSGIDLSEYEFVDKEVVQGSKEVKTSILDSLLKDENNNYVIIEMQRTNADIKNYTYLFKIAGNKISKGEKYKASQTTLIQFKNYIPSDLKDNGIILKFVLKEEKREMIRKGIEAYEIILPNIKKVEYNNLNKLEKKLLMFICKNYQEMKENETDDLDKTIVNELEELGMDDFFKYTYDKDIADKMNEESAREQGKSEGIEIGKNEEKIETVKNMLENDLDLKLISKVTKLSIPEIEEIRNN